MVSPSQMTTTTVHPPPESVVTLTFEVADSSVPVRAVTEMTDCQFELEEIIPRGDGRYTIYYSVDGGDPDRILDLATTHETCQAQFLVHSGPRGVLELTVTDDLPIMVLAAHGAIPRHVIVENTKKTLTVEVLPQDDVSSIIARFEEQFPDAELIARRQQTYATPVFSNRGIERALEDRLTDRQCETLQAAYTKGFYEWPRKISGEQLSEELGITAPTFHQHRRAAERELVGLLFEETGLDGSQP